MYSYMKIGDEDKAVMSLQEYRDINTSVQTKGDSANQKEVALCSVGLGGGRTGGSTCVASHRHLYRSHLTHETC